MSSDNDGGQDSNSSKKSRYEAIRGVFWSIDLLIRELSKAPPFLHYRSIVEIYDAYSDSVFRESEMDFFTDAWGAVSDRTTMPLDYPAMFGYQATSFHELTRLIADDFTQGFCLPDADRVPLWMSQHARLLSPWDPQEIYRCLQLEASQRRLMEWNRQKEPRNNNPRLLLNERDPSEVGGILLPPSPAASGPKFAELVTADELGQWVGKDKDWVTDYLRGEGLQPHVERRGRLPAQWELGRVIPVLKNKKPKWAKGREWPLTVKALKADLKNQKTGAKKKC